MRTPQRKHIIAALLGLGACGALGMGAMTMTASPAHAQFGGVVFDPSNYAQNILTAARTLRTVNLNRPGFSGGSNL